jgi:phosphate-selective porin OprO/OprP
LHIGGAYSFINPGGDVIQYEVRSAFFVPDAPGEPSEVPPLLDTGLIPTEDISLFDLELAGKLGPLHAQSELTFSLVNQIDGPPLAFYGLYAQIGWFLTGETRPYDRDKGVFTEVRPVHDFTCHRGAGAWEIAARWSYITLNDKNIAGGQLNNLEFALNWYWSRHLKLKLIYAHSFVVDPTIGDADVDIFGGRLQAVY